MPFGLGNAPATFQRIMHHLLGDGLDKFVPVFLDDILIYSRTKEEHLQHIRAVLDRLWLEKFMGDYQSATSSEPKLSTLALTLGRTELNCHYQKSRLFLIEVATLGCRPVR